MIVQAYDSRNAGHSWGEMLASPVGRGMAGAGPVYAWRKRIGGATMALPFRRRMGAFSILGQCTEYSNPPDNDPTVAQYVAQFSADPAHPEYVATNRLDTQYCLGLANLIEGAGLTQQAGQAAGSAANLVIPGLGSLVSAIVNLFNAGNIKNAEANQAMCNVVTAFNEFQAQAEQALTAGTETAESASQAQTTLLVTLNSTLDQFSTAPKGCNSPCGVGRHMNACAAYNQSVRYPAIAATAQCAAAEAGAATGSTPAVASSPLGSLPSWLVPAALVLAGLYFLSEGI